MTEAYKSVQHENGKAEIATPIVKINDPRTSNGIVIEESESLTSNRPITFRQHLRSAKPGLITVLVPLVFLPIPIIFATKSAKCAYVILIMAVYWATEVIPMSITSLMPVALMPWLGVASSKEICPNYFDDANVMYFSGLMLAVAIERWSLHNRIALRVLLLVGSKPIWIMFGFMSITAFLSMWISNTGATAMITPIAVAVLDELAVCGKHSQKEVDTEPETQQPLKDDDRKNSVDSKETARSFENETNKRSKDREFKKFNAALTLSICLAANIGGTGTLIGCSPNITLSGLAEKLFGPSTGINFVSWLLFAVPTMLINLVLCWLLLTLMFLGPSHLVQGCLFCRKSPATDNESQNVAVAVFRREYKNLGPMSFAEGSVLAMFIATVLLWITRKPDIFPGWSSLLGHTFATDASVGTMISVLLFLWPSRRPNNLFFRRKTDRSSPVTTPSLLDWPTINKNLPWSVLLLIGGGFALAFCCKSSGLSHDISLFLSALHVLPQWLVLVILSVLATVSSTFAGIVPTGAIFLPIVAEMGQTLNINPLAMMISTAFAASYAYVLPVSTPPNAIAYAYGRFTLLDMMKAGSVLCVVHIFVLQLAIVSWGRLIYGLDTFPDWARPPNTTTVSLT